MHRSVRRRRRGTVALQALALSVLAACEDPAEFTEPEEISFAAVAIDMATVRPREGERLTAGATGYDVTVAVHWQDMPANSVLGVWLELHDTGADQILFPEGGLAASFDTLDSATGSTSFETTVTLPVVSPFCGSYDQLRILAVVFPGGEAPPNEAYRDEVLYEVSGSDWSGACVSDVFRVINETSHRIGEPILIYGRALSDSVDVSLPGARQDDNVFPEFVELPEWRSLYPVPNDGYVIAFVPVGATTGRVRVFDAGAEVRYGADGAVDLTIAASADDVLEPNDSVGDAAFDIYFHAWDPWGTWGAYGFNPSLTLTGADLTPDPVAPAYGVGDWLLVVGVGDATTETDVCINVASHLGYADDIDLIVYDSTGAIAAESGTVSGAEAVRIDDVSGTDTYWAWVAPFLAGFSSTTGGYAYEVGPCDDATGTEIARPDGPLGFVAGGAVRIDPTRARRWGGWR